MQQGKELAGAYQQTTQAPEEGSAAEDIMNVVRDKSGRISGLKKGYRWQE